MIIRGTPKCISNYLIVNNEDSNKLHKAGYQPEYIDDIFVYYRWTQKLQENYKTILGGKRIAKNIEI